MIRETGHTWSELATGMYLEDPDGEAWKIVKIKDGHVGVVNKAGDRRVLPPMWDEYPVTLLVLTEFEMVEYISSELGGEYLGEQWRSERDNGGKPVNICAAFPTKKDPLNSPHLHLRYYHGIYLEPTRGIKEAIRAHDADHVELKWDRVRSRERQLRVIPHIHLPEGVQFHSQIEG